MLLRSCYHPAGLYILVRLPWQRGILSNTYSTVGRSIADIYDQGAYIFTEASSS